ncbi:MAG: malonyl-CoA decarboxylase domain-containing protein, partial [Acetobacteraceae bacterium]
MSDIATEAGLMDRAMRRVASLWRDLAWVVQRSPQASNDFAEEFRACLEARGGEVSARNRAAALAERYRGLDEAGRLGFLRALAAFDSDGVAVTRAMAPILIRLGARYLVKEAPHGKPGRALDPVAHFHLSNGARVERLNWRADVSENG